MRRDAEAGRQRGLMSQVPWEQGGGPSPRGQSLAWFPGVFMGSSLCFSVLISSFLFVLKTILKRFYSLIFRERGSEERNGERHRYARDTSTGSLSHAPN